MRHVLVLLSFLLAPKLSGQDPTAAPLPAKFDGLPQTLLVHHFPEKVYASTDADEPETFFWKHNTSLLSKIPVRIVEFGAYLFYNDQWNLRASYQPKDFQRWFDCPGAQLKAGQPYTFPDNWRRDVRVTGGWAMWYFVAEDETGAQSFGMGALETMGELLKDQKTIH